MKKRLSFILVCILLLNCFPISVFAAKSLWGGTGGNIPQVKVSVSMGAGKYDPYAVDHGAYMAFGGSGRDKYAVRMKAIPIDESKGGNQEYFTGDYPFDGSNGTNLYMLSHGELTKADGYYDDDWKYFNGTTTNYEWPVVQAFKEGAVSASMTTYGGASGEQEALLEACGYKGNKNISLTNPSNIDKIFHCDALENDTEDHKQRKELAKYFGLEGQDAESFYIVTELIPIMREYFFGIGTMADEGRTTPGLIYVDNVTVAGLNIGKQMEWFVGESLATFMADDPQVNGRPTLAFGPVNESFADGYPLRAGRVTAYVKGYSSCYQWYQTDAFFPNYTVVNKNEDAVKGYSIYSFIEKSTAQVGGNVAVEYDGDVNTSEPGKFKSTGSLIDKGSTTANAYWDFLQSKWVDSSDNAQLLKFTGKIDMTEEYALCFTGTAKHNINGGDIKLEQALQNSFEVSPGQGYNSGSLQWGSPRATGGATNVGYVWKVMTLDGFDNVGSIKQKFESSFNSAQHYGTLSTVTESKTTEKYKEYDVLEGSWLNALEGKASSSPGVLEKGIDGKYSFKKDKQLGMGYEFIIRGTPVKSREITVLVEGNESGGVDSVSSSQTWEEEYTTAKSITHSVDEVPDYVFVGWIAVPKQDDGVTSSIESRLRSSRCEAGALFSAAVGGAPTNEANSPSPTVLGIGSTLNDRPPDGYTIYRIAYKGPPIPQIPGEVILPAYMLNRYFNNIIQTSSQLAGAPEKFTLARDWTWEKWLSYVYCDEDGSLIGPDSHKKNWVIEYYDAASGNEFGLDNGMIDRYYPKGTGNWGSSVRSKLTRAWQESMNTEFMPENTYVVDYAFNLVRNNSDFGDARSISGVSYRSYASATGDSSDMLRIRSQFGVIPTVVKRAAPARNSTAVLKTYTETFNIKSRYQLTGSATGNHVKTNLHSHRWYCGGCRGNSEDGYWCPGHTCSHTWESLIPSTCMGFYGIRAGRVNTINYQFKASALKYTTKDDLGKGQNDFLGSAQSKPLSTGRRNSTAGSITPSNFYRFTTVRYSGVDLLFHPENYMVFKIGGTEFSAINAQNYVKAYVMSEVRRTSRVSGMYFFRLNADITSVPGTVYSDSMQGGTGIYGLGDTVSIPAGADVTVAADPTGVAIDLYGYVLDIVQEEDDGKIGAVGAGRAYNSVVANGDNAYQKWGNNSRDKIKQHFVTWCNDMLKVENYAADFKLYVDSGLKSENFSATIGSVEAGSAGVVEEGIYQLVVEKGVLQTSKGDYSAMLDQIATDYGCSRGEAESMFQESAIYTAIINGMETCLNPKNNSKGVLDGLTYTPDIKSQWTNDLGGNGNWYDEVSRTFVIRRFTNLGNKLCDVIATDKIDYQLAPDGSAKPGENVNASLTQNSFDARWELNIFFDQNAASQVNDLLLGSSRYYDPQNGSTGFDPANRAYSVLFNSIPVANADFKIPASSTQDFYN